MHQDSLMIKTMDAMAASMSKNISNVFNDKAYADMGIDGKKMAEKLTAKTMQRTKQNALQLLNEDMVDIYYNYFTTEDIDNFTVFYNTPSAQKMINLTPDISKDVMTLLTTKFQASNQAAMLKDIEEMRKEMEQKVQKKKS